jgi:Uma2 family endonuclease
MIGRVEAGWRTDDMGLRASQSMGVEEFLARFGGKTERYELLDGLPIPRSTGTAAHLRIVRRVIGALRRQLSGRPWRVVTETPVLIDRATLLVPDVLVTFKSFDQPDPGSSDPAVVVEILSADTQARDRGDKWLKYAALASLQHYVLIATDDHRIEAFSRQDAARWSYRTYQDGLKASIALPALDVCLLASEIYEGIELDRRASGASGVESV